jgi:hypothetical protein
MKWERKVRLVFKCYNVTFNLVMVQIIGVRHLPKSWQIDCVSFRQLPNICYFLIGSLANHSVHSACESRWRIFLNKPGFFRNRTLFWSFIDLGWHFPALRVSSGIGASSPITLINPQAVEHYQSPQPFSILTYFNIKTHNLFKFFSPSKNLFHSQPLNFVFIFYFHFYKFVSTLTH